MTLKIVLEIDVSGGDVEDQKLQKKIKQWVRENTHHIERYNFGDDEDEVTATIDGIEIEEG